jgi:hypothetical protein
MARLDTHWHANPKVLALGLDGMGLHSWSISYCDAELTDGFIPTGALPQLPRLKQAVTRLVDLHRWEVVEGGYQLHDYLHYNRSREQVVSERAAAAERMQRARVRPNNSRSSDRSSGEVQPLPVPVPVPVPVPEVPTELLEGHPPTPFGESSDEVRPNSVATPRMRRGKPKREPPAEPACCPNFARTGSEHWQFCPNAAAEVEV